MFSFVFQVMRRFKDQPHLFTDSFSYLLIENQLTTLNTNDSRGLRYSPKWKRMAHLLLWRAGSKCYNILRGSASAGGSFSVDPLNWNIALPSAS